MVSFKEKVENIKSLSRKHNRDSIVNAIEEYERLVHYRGEVLGEVQDSKSLAKEETIQGFVTEAVTFTFGMVWNINQLPFTIKSIEQEGEYEYEDETIELANELNVKDTRFKACLKSCIQMYFEFGSSFLYLFEDEEEKSFSHIVYSLDSVYVEYDEFGRIKNILIEEKKQYGDFCIYFERKEKNVWNVNKLDSHNSYELTETKKINYTPIFELSSHRLRNEFYPIGSGLRSIPDIKRADAIIKSLTKASSELLNVEKWISSDFNSGSSGIIVNARRSALRNLSRGTEENPTIISGEDPMRKIGYLQKPIQIQPASDMYQMIIVQLRERFGFISRLLSVKDDVQMTATEVSIRSKSDMNRMRDFLDEIYTFLNALHSSQLKILNNFGRIKLSDRDLLVEFIHNSIFEKESEREELGQINVGMDLISKGVQLSKQFNEAGINVNTQELLTRISNLTGLIKEDNTQPRIAEETITKLIDPRQWIPKEEEQ